MKKKFFIPILASVAAIPTIVSCGVQPAWQKREYFVNIDSTTASPRAFGSLYNNFSGPSAIQDYLTSSYLIQTMYEDELSIESNGIKPEDKGKKDQSLNYEIKHPSYKYLSFVNAKAILIVDKNGNEFVFDNDKHEKGRLPQGQVSSSLVINLTSDDPHSINSRTFGEKLDQAVKVQMFLKDDVYWVDSKGNQTKYKLTPRDYWYGFKWQRLGYINYRNDHGGGDAVDAKAKQNIPNYDPKADYLGSEINNLYLLQLFGFDTQDFDNEHKYIQEYTGKNPELKNQEAITFSLAKGATQSFFKGFFRKIVIPGIFRPLPSSFVDDRTAKISKIVNGKKVGPYGESGEALQFGIYWYGQTFDKDMLYNSPYIQTRWDLHHRNWAINKYYPRTGWKDSINYHYNTINFLYTKYSSPEAFANSQFNSYKEGTIPMLSYNIINDSQKNLVAQDKNKYGWKLSRVETKDSILKSYFNLLVPGSMKQNFVPQPGVVFDENYYAFNDNYAKLAYGVSRKELATGGARIVDYLTSGVGLTFRQIIANAWNLYTTQQSASPIAEPWYNFLDPDNHIKFNANSKRPRDFYDDANTIQLVDPSGKIFYTKNLETEKQQNFNNVSDSSKQFEAPNYEVLKAEMKKILDKFYADNHLPATAKVEWTNHSWYTNTPSNWIAALEKAQKAINGLDPRLNMKLLWPITDLKQRINYIRYGVGHLSYSWWSYDYDGIGTAFDGRVQAKGVPYAILSSIYDRGENSQIAKSYPLLYKYAKAAKEFFDPFAKKGVIRPFEDWKNAPNAYDFGADKQQGNPNLIQYFLGSVVDAQVPVDPNKPDGPKKTVKVYKSFVDQINEKAKTDADKVDFDFGAESAIFNLGYQENAANSEEDLVKLSAELSSFLTFGLSDLIAISSSTPSVTLRNPNISIPYVDEYGDFTPIDMVVIKPFYKTASKINTKINEGGQ